VIPKSAWCCPTESHPRWGAWVENACLAHAWNRGQTVYYWREEPLEVDGVFVGSWGKWAVEVKTGNFGLRDLPGLFEFCRRYPAFQPLVLCSRERIREFRLPNPSPPRIPWENLGLRLGRAMLQWSKTFANCDEISGARTILSP
jgi:hypothetical protein